MTPIKNVSDRERDLTAERTVYRANAERLMTMLMERTAERDELRADLAKLKAQEPDIYVHEDGLQVWGANANPALGSDPSFTAYYLAAGAQGHTREQPALDDRREGLDAHHVYCRVIGEDV